MSKFLAAIDDLGARTNEYIGVVVLVLALLASLATAVRHPDLFPPMQDAESGLSDSDTFSILSAMQSP